MNRFDTEQSSDAASEYGIADEVGQSQRDPRAPLIIIGAGRSGTSLLTRMLGAHPCIDFAGETDFLLPRLWRAVFEDNSAWNVWPLYCAQQPAFADSAMRRELHELNTTRSATARERAGVLLAQFMMGLLAPRPAAVWGYKENWNGSSAHNHPWDCYDAAFPKATWLHIVRHPLAFARSAARWDRCPLDVAYLYARLRDWVAIVNKSRERRQTGRFFEIRYESLVDNARGQITPIFQSRGLQWHPACSEVQMRWTLASTDSGFPVLGKLDLDFRNLENSITGFCELVEELGYSDERTILLERPLAGSTPASREAATTQEIAVRNLPLSGPFSANGGNAYVAGLSDESVTALKAMDPLGEPLLTEDGRPLGPGSSLHQTIRDQGRGRFSLWGSCVYFSASDNSDPNDNGRRYQLSWPAKLEPIPVSSGALNMRRGSWSVASTVRAPKGQIDRFVSYYLSLGAEQMFIFLDDPLYMEIDRNFKQGRVHWFLCDTEYWTKRGVQRPGYLVDRQESNIAYAAQLNASEWLLHVDNDELIFSKDAIDKTLAGIPESVFSLLIPPLEAVYVTPPTEFFATNYFKRALYPPTPQSQILLENIYGDMAEITQAGLFGHRVGKSFIRTSYKAERYTTHAAFPLNRRLAASVEEPRIELLHFDAISFDAWREKFVSRAYGEVLVPTMSTQRRAQVERIRATLETEGEDGLRRLFTKMHVLSEQKLEFALAAGFVVERRLDWAGDHGGHKS